MLMYGGQTFRNSSSKVTSHIVEPGPQTTRLNKYVGSALQTVPGSSAKMPAAADDDPRMEHGVWYRQAYEMEEGKIFGLKLYSTTSGACRANSMILLRLRSDGPYMTINAVLGPVAAARYQKIPCFQGRADVITPEEAKAYGVTLSPSMIKNLMDPEELEEDFEIIVLDKGQPKPTKEKVRTATGVKEVLVKPMAARRVRIKRRS